MIITAIITLGSIIAWAVTARALFRHWVRKTDLGYWLIAILAIGGVPLLPAIAFVGFIVRNPPLSQRELKAKTQALEFENTRLRLAERGYDVSQLPTGRVRSTNVADDDDSCSWGIRCGVDPEDAH